MHKPKVGDIQVDPNGSEWVIIQIFPRLQGSDNPEFPAGIIVYNLSRVKRNSLAHRVHSEGTPIIAQSLTEE